MAQHLFGVFHGDLIRWGKGESVGLPLKQGNLQLPRHSRPAQQPHCIIAKQGIQLLLCVFVRVVCQIYIVLLPASLL